MKQCSVINKFVQKILVKLEKPRNGDLKNLLQDMLWVFESLTSEQFKYFTEILEAEETNSCFQHLSCHLVPQARPFFVFV